LARKPVQLSTGRPRTALDPPNSCHLIAIDVGLAPAPRSI
jgi:hypothetical protein